MTRTGGAQQSGLFTTAELERLRLAAKAGLAELECDLLK